MRSCRSRLEPGVGNRDPCDVGEGQHRHARRAGARHQRSPVARAAGQRLAAGEQRLVRGSVAQARRSAVRGRGRRLHHRWRIRALGVRVGARRFRRAAFATGKVTIVDGDSVQIADRDRIAFELVDPTAATIYATLNERLPDVATWTKSLTGAGIAPTKTIGPERRDPRHRPVRGHHARDAVATLTTKLESAALWAARVEPVTRHYDSTWGALRASPPTGLHRRAKPSRCPTRRSISYRASYVVRAIPRRRLRAAGRRQAGRLLVRDARDDRARPDRPGVRVGAASSAPCAAISCRPAPLRDLRPLRVLQRASRDRDRASSPRFPASPKGAVRADRTGQGRHVRVRADDLRARAHRSRLLRDRVRHDPPQLALPRLRRPLRSQRHRRRRQDHQPRAPRRRGADGDGRALRRRLQPRHGAVRGDAADDRAEGLGAHLRDHRRDHAADRDRQCLRGRRRRLLRSRHVPAVRAAVGANARRAARGRPRRDRRAQAGPRRLCAVEGRQTGRAGMGFSVGSGPARVAHRVLGDDRERTSATRSISTAAARI